MMQELHISRAGASAVISPKPEDTVGIAKTVDWPIAG
jgi:hypothetical protein